MMDAGELEALAARAVALVQDPESLPVVVYFAVLGLAVLLVVLGWARACARSGIAGLLAAAASLPLAGTALYVCWGAIFAFMMVVAKDKGCGPGESPAELLGCDTPAWKEHDVFVQAYVDVTETPVGWASSSQLLMFVLSGCTFLHTESKRRGMGGVLALCYVITGFLGAISLAFPLLFAHLFALRAVNRDVAVSVPVPLVACNLLAMLGVLLLPLTYESHRRTVYTWALLLVHFILGVPCLLGRPAVVSGRVDQAQARVKLAALYAFLAGASLLMHMHNVAVASLALSARGLGAPAIVEELMLGPFRGSLCQFSISFDVVFTSVAAAAYMVGSRPLLGLGCALLTPVLSVAVTFPAFLAIGLMGEATAVPAAGAKKKNK